MQQSPRHDKTARMYITNILFASIRSHEISETSSIKLIVSCCMNIIMDEVSLLRLKG